MIFRERERKGERETGVAARPGKRPHPLGMRSDLRSDGNLAGIQASHSARLHGETRVNDQPSVCLCRTRLPEACRVPGRSEGRSLVVTESLKVMARSLPW